MSAPAGPLIAICMATHEPQPERLRRQLDSIRAQTWERWVCVISDDASSPEAGRVLADAVGDDGRFLVDASAQRLGFLRNFERALRLAPVEARMIALADQDDRWHPGKLEALAGALEREPAARLAYADMRILDGEGRVLSDTYWYLRRNRCDDMASLLVANVVTGAAAMFRRELLDDALPFPSVPAGAALYHDHWLALCALATGPVAYVDEPLHDYYRYDESVTVREAPDWIRPERGPAGRARLHWRRLTRRLRMGSSAPSWEAVYRERWLLIRRLATVLELRLGPRIQPRHRRSIERLLGAEHSPADAAWLALRCLRPLIGRNETLARERVLLGGLIWRWTRGRDRGDVPWASRLLRNPALLRAIVWRRLAAARRSLRPEAQRVPASVPSGRRGGPATEDGPGEPPPAPIVVDYFGRDGSTAMMGLLASSPEVLVDGGYPFEASHLPAVLGAEQPERAWREATASIPGAAGSRYYAEKMIDSAGVGVDRLPSAQLVVMLRDPRDTWLSIESFSRAVGRGSIGGEGGRPERLGRFVRRQRRRLAWVAGLEAGPGLAIVRYEDLVTHPPAVAAELSRLLGIDLDPRAGAGDFRLRWVHGTSRDLASSVGRWRRELDPETAELLRSELGELMETLGFAP